MEFADPAGVAMARWSIATQVGVACLLALFFSALSRTVRLAEVRLWALAWFADAVAIGAVLVAAFLVHPIWLSRLALVVYAAGKTAYAHLLVEGARHHQQPNTAPFINPRQLFLILAMWSLLLGFFAPNLGLVQLGEALIVGSLLTYGAVWVLRHPRLPRSRWLGWALLLQGLLFLHYVPVLAPVIWGGDSLVSYVNSFSSFFDAGAELVVALATLVALESSTTEHLQHLNLELERSQEQLRTLVDIDPLTKLANRRALRVQLDAAKEGGAALIFLDLDSFKMINDRYGHATGDACLIRVAEVLRSHFRAQDTIFRWGGDEFLVVAPGLTREAADDRVTAVRIDLARAAGEALPCSISVGVAMLAPDGEPDSALKKADEEMYADKIRQRSRAVSLDTWY